MHRLLIAGNWKMNGNLNSITTLIGSLRTIKYHSALIEIAVFPPMPYLSQVKRLLSDSSIHWGAQDISSQSNGAFTGDISATMLQDFKCHYALVGGASLVANDFAKIIAASEVAEQSKKDIVKM